MPENIELSGRDADGHFHDTPSDGSFDDLLGTPAHSVNDSVDPSGDPPSQQESASGRYSLDLDSDILGSDPEPFPFAMPHRSLHQRVSEHLKASTLKSLVMAVLSVSLAVFLLVMVVSGTKGQSKGTEEKPYVPPNLGYTDPVEVRQLSPEFNVTGTKNLTLDDQRHGAYAVFPTEAEFVDIDPQVAKRAENEDFDVKVGDEGAYFVKEGDNYVLYKVADPNYKKVLFSTKGTTYNGLPRPVDLIRPSKDLTKALVYSEKENGFRHSVKAHYWLLDLSTLELEPLHSLENGDLAKLQYVSVSPQFKWIAFVYENNLYVRDVVHNSAISVTSDGSADIFHGRPDWVYEEEVLGTGGAVWWSPDEQRLAYITFDDTKVEKYDLEFFKKWQYPQIEQLRYPKAGTTDPKLTVNVYNMNRASNEVVPHDDTTLGPNEFIVYDALWTSGNVLLLKETDRTSRYVQYRQYDSQTQQATVVRKVDTATFGGWLANNNAYRDRMYAVDGGYIDKEVYNNHTRLTYFPTHTKDGDVLPHVIIGDSGDQDWEALTSVIGYNKDEKTVYFIGTAGSAIQRYVYEGRLSDGSVRLMGNATESSDVANYDIDLSPNAQYACIYYRGPDLPWQRFVNLPQYFDEADYRDKLVSEARIEANTSFTKSLGQYIMPRKYYETFVTDDNVTLEAIEVRPANFDSRKKYPLLVSVYGGPGLQKLSSNYGYGFEEVVASSLDAIVLFVDPRGTGGRDWTFQGYARDNVGYWEPRDVTTATKKLIDRGYIDANRTAVWGWSYGGFTTLKTMEYDAGSTFKYAMCVAPVTDWQLYDSIYSERYMDLPSRNENYNTTAKVNEVQKFKGLQRFLLMHGTGDDNVHVQNTMQLLDRMNLATVENYDMRIFPDSDHNIVYNNAYVIVYDKLYSWIRDAFSGEFIDRH